MERRSEPRIETDLPVTVKVLPHGPSYPARMLDLSGRGMRLKVGVPLPEDSALAIEDEASLYLGEVAFCIPVNESWSVGVEVHQRCRDTLALANLRRALAESAQPAAQPVGK